MAAIINIWNAEDRVTRSHSHKNEIINSRYQDMNNLARAGDLQMKALLDESDESQSKGSFKTIVAIALACLGAYLIVTKKQGNQIAFRQGLAIGESNIQEVTRNIFNYLEAKIPGYQGVCGAVEGVNKTLLTCFKACQIFINSAKPTH